MSWIEGIGDEVIITFTILIGLGILLAAWLSTVTRDIPFISVIIVQLTRRRLRQQNAQRLAEATQPSEGTGTVDNVEQNENRAEDSISNTDTQEEHEPSEGNTEIQENPATTVGDVTEASLTGPESSVIPRHGTVNQEDGLINSDHVADEVKNGSGDKESNSSAEMKSEVEDNTSETVIEKPSESELRQKRLEFYNGSKSQSDNVNVTEHSNNSLQVEQNDSQTISDTCQNTTQCAPKQQSISQFLSAELAESLQDQGSSVDPVDSGNNEQTNEAGNTSETGSNVRESVPLPGEIRVRIKFLNDTQKLVTSFPGETIGNFRRKHFPVELSESKLVRFIFNGQDLRNDLSTLESHNVLDNSVLHCLVTQPRQPEQPQHGNHGDDEVGLDIGMYMFPLFGLLLGVVWYMRFMYRQFFNVTSTLTLSGITFLFIAAAISSFGRPRGHVHID